MNENSPRPQAKTIPPPPFRQGNLYVSRAVQAQLVLIAQARNELIGEDKPCSGCPPRENQMTADKIADEVLAKWIKENYPGLSAFEDKQKALHKETLEFIKKFHEPEPEESKW